MPLPNTPEGYTLHEEIGSGSFGVVLRATVPGDPRNYAVKIVGNSPALPGKGCLPQEDSASSAAVGGGSGDSSAVTRATREGALLLALGPKPGIITLHTTFSVDGCVWLVEELGQRTLATASKSLNGVAEHLLRPWIVDIARGLCAIHRSGWVHLDVKPSNIVLCGEPEAPETWAAKLIDFGLAGPQSRSLQGSPTCPRRAFKSNPVLDAPPDRRPGAVGTPSYYGPETHAAEAAGRAAPTTPAQDAWSLGVTLAMGALGYNPFARRTAGAVREAVLAGFTEGGDSAARLWPKSVQELSPSLRHLLRGLLRADPILRLSCDAALHHPWAAARPDAEGSGGAPEPTRAELARAERRHKWSPAVVRHRLEHAGVEGARRGGSVLGQAPGALQRVLAGAVPVGGMLVSRA